MFKDTTNEHICSVNLYSVIIWKCEYKYIDDNLYIICYIINRFVMLFYLYIKSNNLKIKHKIKQELTIYFSKHCHCFLILILELILIANSLLIKSFKSKEPDVFLLY